MLRTSHQHDAHHDRYLITYADVITLLLCLFVILYSSAQVDGGKFRELAHAASSYFKAPVSQQDSAQNAAERKKIFEKQSPTAETSANNLAHTAREQLKTQLSDGALSLDETAGGMKLTLAEELLFDAGNAELHPQALETLDRLASILKNGMYEITVDGHTDCVPVHSFRYESNWHLSVERALAVGYYLTQHGVAENSIAIRGFGSQKPVADNATPENRKRNRRVEIMVKTN